ncbi:hypothetical protein [Acetobacterium sp.]|jgi:hypothetical protein|nr:hypothetical protein [Acetobacterium sp.]MDO9493772.1 hypothetical protein [Acetobacterium sp.]
MKHLNKTDLMSSVICLTEDTKIENQPVKVPDRKLMYNIGYMPQEDAL